MALAIAMFATVVTFTLTFLPVLLRMLSLVYPWTFVIVGGVLTRLTGPRADRVGQAEVVEGFDRLEGRTDESGAHR